MFTPPFSSSRKAASRQRSPIARACRYRLESLEPRQLLAVDLSAALINVDPSVARGQRETADLVITNNGDTTARGTIRTPIYAVAEGTNFDPLTSVVLGSVRTNLRLAPGDSVTIPISRRIPRALNAGTFTMVANVNPTNKFNEADLTNNIASAPFTVTPSGTDISAAITNLSPAAVTRGRETATLTLTNNGTASANGRIRIPIFAVASGSTFDPTTTRPLTTVTRSIRLAPGATTTIPLSVPLSRTTTSGNFQLVATTDSTNVLNEANLANNIAQSDFFTVLPRNGLTVNGNNQLTTANGTVLTDVNGNFLTTASGNTINSTVGGTVITNGNGTVLTDAFGSPFFATTSIVNGTPVTTVSSTTTPIATTNSLTNLGLNTPVSIVSPSSVLPTNFTSLTPTSLNLTPTSALSTSQVTPTSLNLFPTTTTTATQIPVGNSGLTSLLPTNLNTFPILSGNSIPVATSNVGSLSTTSF